MVLADSLFRPPITPFCSLLPSYPFLLSFPILPLSALFSHLLPSYSLLPSYPFYSLLPSHHLLPPTCHSSPITNPHIRLATTNLTCFILSPHLLPLLLLLLISSAMLLLFQLANFPLVNPAPTQLLFSKHSISKNRTFFLISHYYHFRMKT